MVGGGNTPGQYARSNARCPRCRAQVGRSKCAWASPWSRLTFARFGTCTPRDSRRGVALTRVSPTPSQLPRTEGLGTRVFVAERGVFFGLGCQNLIKSVAARKSTRVNVVPLSVNRKLSCAGNSARAPSIDGVSVGPPAPRQHRNRATRIVSEPVDAENFHERAHAAFWSPWRRNSETPSQSPVLFVPPGSASAFPEGRC